jgi:hypothetical protein
MKIIRRTSFLIALAATALLAGCGTMDMGDVYRGDRGDRGPNDPYYDRTGSDVQGTVVRVNTRDRLIFLDRRNSGGRYGLRNDGDQSDTGAEIAVYYDNRTEVQYQGRSYRPEDLEPGDRIQADITGRSGEGLLARTIQVVYDASSNGSVPYDDRADRGTRDPYNGGVRDNPYDRGGQGDTMTELRGTVRSVDTRNQTVEIQPSSSSSLYDSRDSSDRSGVVVVEYDSRTTVEFQGRRYDPTNLERGDEVEIAIRRDRDRGDRLTADQITVVGEGQGGRR